MSNVNLSERRIQTFTVAVAAAGTTATLKKEIGAIIGLIVIPSVTANLTFEVSIDGAVWSPLTPPVGDFTGVTNNSNKGKAFPAEWLACFSPYPQIKMTFSAAQTSGATVHMPVMA